MSFGSFEHEVSAPRSEINMVPLIDVMLVLLVIFIITAPMLTNAVQLKLPTASSQPDVPPPEPQRIAIDAARTIHWNNEALSRDQLGERLHALAARDRQAELQLLADETVPYGDVAQLLSDAASAGLNRIRFVTRPDAPKP